MFGLPQNLRKKLSAFERKLFFAESLSTSSIVICSIVIPFLILFIFDRYDETPKIIRLILLSFSLITVVLASFAWLINWLIKPRSYVKLAKIIQKKYSSIGDRLQGAVELATQNNPSISSEELKNAAITQVATEVDKYDFSKAINKHNTFKLFAISLILLSITFLVANFAPPAFINALIRFVNPFSDTPRFTFTSITDLPNEIFVPVSEQFTISSSVDEKNSLFIPEKAYAKINANKITAYNDCNKFLFSFNGVQKNSKLIIRAGDFKKNIKVNPIYRPSLEKINITITLPDYLDSQKIQTLLMNNTLSILEGSTFIFNGKYSRELSDISIYYENSELDNIQLNNLFSLTKQLHAPKVGKPATITLSAVDIYNLQQIPLSSIKVESFPDSPPFSSISGIPKSSAILPEQVLNLSLKVDDDFGLKSIQLILTSFIRKEDNWVENSQTKIPFNTETNNSKNFQTEFKLSPTRFNLEPGSLLKLQLSAIDQFPDRQPTLSDEKLVYILSHQEHFELIIEKLREIMNKIDEIKNAEYENLNQNQKLQEKLNKESNPQNFLDDLKKLASSEELNKKNTENICSSAAEILNEALKNQFFNNEILQKWTDLFSKLSDIASNQFSQSSSGLNNMTRSQEKSKQSLENIENIQKDIIKKLEELAKIAENKISHSLASNFSARLKKEAQNEKSIQSSLKEILPESIGLDYYLLPVSISNSINELTNNQKNISESVKNIFYDMNALSKRLPSKLYSSILEEFEKEKFYSKLLDTEEKIQTNKLSEAIYQTQSIEQKLLKWAKSLDEKFDNLQEAQGNNTMELPHEIPLELLKALTRETLLRENTRELNLNKESYPNLQQKSDTLAIEQANIKTPLLELSEKYSTQIPQLIKLIQKITAPMTEAELLLSNTKTGEETIAAQTEAIEILSSVLSQLTANSKILSMMSSAQAGLKPGFGMNAESNTPNTQINGQAYLQPTNQTKSNKVFSTSDFNIPAKYRPIYESYLKSIEVKQ